MKTYTRDEIYELHKKYTQGAHPERFLDSVWTHSQIVAEIADRICDFLKKTYEVTPNRELVQTGALLHDIGVYKCHDDELNPVQEPGYISHGIEGYKILKKESYPEYLARFPLSHTGTGITTEDIERENFNLELKNYIPVTLEEEIVCYADKFHTKYPAFDTFDKAKSRLEKFDPSKGILMNRFKKKFGIPDVSDLEAKYKDWQEELDHYLTSLSEAKK